MTHAITMPETITSDRPGCLKRFKSWVAYKKDQFKQNWANGRSMVGCVSEVIIPDSLESNIKDLGDSCPSYFAPSLTPPSADEVIVNLVTPKDYDSRIKKTGKKALALIFIVAAVGKPFLPAMLHESKENRMYTCANNRPSIFELGDRCSIYADKNTFDICDLGIPQICTKFNTNLDIDVCVVDPCGKILACRKIILEVPQGLPNILKSRTEQCMLESDEDMPLKQKLLSLTATCTEDDEGDKLPYGSYNLKQIQKNIPEFYNILQTLLSRLLSNQVILKEIKFSADADLNALYTYFIERIETTRGMIEEYPARYLIGVFAHELGHGFFNKYKLRIEYSSKLKDAGFGNYFSTISGLIDLDDHTSPIYKYISASYNVETRSDLVAVLLGWGDELNNCHRNSPFTSAANYTTCDTSDIYDHPPFPCRIHMIEQLGKKFGQTKKQLIEEAESAEK